jgi:hypothetical protein
VPACDPYALLAPLPCVRHGSTSPTQALPFHCPAHAQPIPKLRVFLLKSLDPLLQFVFCGNPSVHIICRTQRIQFAQVFLTLRHLWFYGESGALGCGNCTGEI